MYKNIIKTAQKRGKKNSLHYSGALIPSEADYLLNNTKNSYLVDVRTHAELTFVGYIPNSIHIEWQSYTTGTINVNFLKILEIEIPDLNSLIMFICRSGHRSHEAATHCFENNFKNIYNVLEGFEGDKNDNSQRNKVNGWKLRGLDWKQQ